MIKPDTIKAPFSKTLKNQIHGVPELQAEVHLTKALSMFCRMKD